MSTLADLTCSPDDLASAAFVAINADATIKDASHLGAANRVFKWSVPRDAPMPRLLIAASMLVADRDTGFHTGMVGVEAKMRCASDSQPDAARLARIVKRCGQIIVGHGTLTLAGFRFLDVVPDISSGVLQNPDTPDEATIAAKFVVNFVRIP